MLIIATTLLSLVIKITNQQIYEVQFKLASFGTEFQYGNSSNLYSVRSNVSSMTRCASICCTEVICQTFDYDTSSCVCRLYSIWADQGTIIPSSSLTSQVGYVQRSYELYSLYLKPCNSSIDINRYLTCTNGGVWSCQTGQVYNGTICQIQVSNYTTPNYKLECLQNQTMYWNGTDCLPYVYSWRWNNSGITVAGVSFIGNANPDKLFQPHGMVLDSNGTLYVCDQYNNRIQKWPKNAKNATTVAGLPNGTMAYGANAFHYPHSAVLDSNGNLYVTDSANHRVQLWLNGATSGITVAGTGFSGSTSNQLNYPRGLARDPATGSLYITDCWNHRVMRYLVNASSGTVAAGGNGAGTNITQLNYPMGLYLDLASSSLYITNYVSNNVVRWVLGASSWTLIAGDMNGASGSSSTLLLKPSDVVLDFMKNVYVVDSMNHRVQFFRAGSLNGTTIAGVTGVTRTDPYGFYEPHGVVLDAQLNLYVSDCFNHRVQKFTNY